MRFQISMLLLSLLVSGCTTSRLRLSGTPGIVLLTEIDKQGRITDQRLITPGEIESSKVSTWEVRRPDLNGTLRVDIIERGKPVLQRTLPPGVLGFIASKADPWEFNLLQAPRANPPPPPPNFLPR